MRPPPCSIAVIAVSYYNSVEVKRLIESLKNQVIQDWHLLIIDNSTDRGENERISSLQGWDSRIRVISPPENLGYMPAAIAGYSCLPESEWTIICNSDIELALPDIFSKILEIDSSKFAVVAPKISDAQTGSNLNPFLEQAPSLIWTLLRLMATSHLALYKLMQKFHHLRLNTVNLSKRAIDENSKHIFAAHGSCFIMASRFAKDLTGVGFQLLYGEEFRVASAARRAGEIILYEPTIEIVHYSHAATRSLDGKAVMRMQFEALKSHLRQQLR